jgi:HNH endonuclease
LSNAQREAEDLRPHNEDRTIEKKRRGSNDPAKRFLTRLDQPEAMGDPSTCVLWTRAVDSQGYGQFKVRYKNLKAHRWAYEQWVGPIPEGLTLDHLCRVKKCVNPVHLEVVPLWENILRSDSAAALNARKTHCPEGHPYDEVNTYSLPTNAHMGRTCRTCRTERSRERARQRKLGR